MTFHNGGCLSRESSRESFRREFFAFGIGAWLVLAGCLAGGSALGGPVSKGRKVVELSLKDYLHQVLQHNQSIQAQLLGAEVNHRKAQGQRGIFEPQLEVSVTREANRRTNNLQQAAAISGQLLFNERNNLYDGGIEQRIPTGGKIRLGATMSDLGNNLNPYGGFINSSNSFWTRQYQTFLGATFTQPLLKNAGFTATLAPLRLAALDSDIAFEQYRRQLMLTTYRAEGAYWNLYFAQEQVRFFDESVAVARQVLKDSREKLKAGQGAELDVMEAKSALALRNTKRNDAVQNYYDALGHLQMLTGTAPNPDLRASGSPEFRAADNPHTTNAPPTYAGSFEEAFSLNPDYLIQSEKLHQERVRYGVARNQLLPELDLKAAYGFNGLGLTPGDAWDLASMENTPSWSVGLQLIMPLGGNIKGRNLYKAARLSLQKAYVNLQSVKTEIANSLSMAIQKSQAWRQSIASYQTVVDYNEQLLQTELARFKAGTVDQEKVFDAEANLLDSRQALAGALVQYRRALLQIELSDGAILKNHGLDVTRSELRRQTEAMLDQNEDYSVKRIAPDELFSPVPPPDKSIVN